MFVLRSLCSAGSDGFVHSKPTEEVLGSRQQTFVFPTMTALHSSSEHGPKEPHCRSSLAAPALRFLPRLLSLILQGEPCHPGVSRPPNDSDLSHVKDHECEGRGPPPPAESLGGASPTSEEALRSTRDTPTPSQKYRLEAKSPQATSTLCFEPGALPKAEPGRLGTCLT